MRLLTCHLRMTVTLCRFLCRPGSDEEAALVLIECRYLITRNNSRNTVSFCAGKPLITGAERALAGAVAKLNQLQLPPSRTNTMRTYMTMPKAGKSYCTIGWLPIGIADLDNNPPTIFQYSSMDLSKRCSPNGFGINGFKDLGANFRLEEGPNHALKVLRRTLVL